MIENVLTYQSSPNISNCEWSDSLLSCVVYWGGKKVGTLCVCMKMGLEVKLYVERVDLLNFFSLLLPPTTPHLIHKMLILKD